MFRRSSYASVLSGSAGNNTQSQFAAPARSGAFSHLAHEHASRQHSRTIEADGHHGSMSTSWGRQPLPSYSSQHSYLNSYGGNGPEGTPAASFFVPSYLRGSTHAQKLEDAYKAKIAAHREYRSNHSSNAGSLSTSSSSVNLHKMVPSHRGLTHDIIERAPLFVEDPTGQWPTRWSETDKYSQLEVPGDGREARFSGSQKAHEEAASVRSDYPMPRQCGIYYFEVTVCSRGKEGMIGIGFSGPKVPLSRIPGWEPESYAYHGDDGQCFSNTTSGRAYGPKFGHMDVVGCGFNFNTGEAFFTKNGNYLGVAFKDLRTERPWFPTVGMKKTGETLRVNFGQDPFIFDIDKMMEDEKKAINREVSNTQIPALTKKNQPPSDETTLIHNLIAQYLAHDGYVETARAFSQEVAEETRALVNGDETNIRYLNAEEDLDAINRQKIRSAILDGDIDKALKHTNAYYPHVLRDNENIYFKLRCRKFIEMIRRCNELQNQQQASVKRNTHHNDYDADVFDHQMELDEQFNSGPWNNGDSMSMDTSDGATGEKSGVMLEKLTQETIAYGTELKSEFSGDPRREVKKALEDTFALLAYQDASQSSLAPLLEVGGRVPVAEELNSAILLSLGKSASAALERLCQQTEALVGELAEDGGPGAFINVKRDYLL